MAATRNSRPSELAVAVAASLAPRLPRGARVCVALSGGRDSVALLHLLIELRHSNFPDLQLSALHVHHGLSAQADAWAEFCAALCREHDVAFRCARVVVEQGAAEGLEAAAREARYAVFAGYPADWLLLAHHRDDQAETLLLNLLRGAGLHGLAAMPEERPLAPGGPTLLRPLLHVPRAQIEAWLAARGLPWIDDESNDDNRLRRNFLRRQVLPLIGREFPAAAAALARAAGHLAEMSALADEIALSDTAGRVAGNSLLLAPFNELPPARRANLLRLFLRRQGLRMPDSRYLAEMIRQLASAGAAAHPSFRLDGACLQVSRGRLWCCPPGLASPPAALSWRGEKSLAWAGGRVCFQAAVGQGIARRVLTGAVEIRARRGGEMLQPDARRPRRPLKKLLQEHGLPQWQRDGMPLLWCGDTLLWAGGVGYASDAGVLAGPEEPGWVLSWERPDGLPGG